VKLRYQIELQRATITTGATGQREETWTKLATVWASCKHQNSKKDVAERVDEIQSSVLFTLRCRDLTGDDRIVWDGKTFILVGDPIPDERRFYMSVEGVS
jgi:head-tail adaptor